MNLIFYPTTTIPILASVDSLFFTCVGVFVLYILWEKIGQERNVALAIVVAALLIVGTMIGLHGCK